MSATLRLTLEAARSNVHELAPTQAGVHAALHALAHAGASEPELVELVRAHGHASELPVLFYYLRWFEQAGALQRTLVHDAVALATWIPQVGGRRHGLADLPACGRVRLSRFAYLRAHAGQLLLESPRAHFRVRIDDARVAMACHTLAGPDGASLTELAHGFEPATIELFVRLLLASGHVIAADDESEHRPPLATWAFHDLAFHVRSRVGRNDAANGKTYPFLGKLEPLPAIELPQGESIIELPRPDLDALAQREPSFTTILESRRTIREQGEHPITLAALAEFLYRAARVKGWAAAEPPVHYELTTRPSPGGGACHELELYIAVNRCADLDSGLYHYDPLGHRLTRICGRKRELELLLADTPIATGTGLPTQVLIIIAARFARMMWPYEGIAYAATLKNVGALLQTMYLVATAMGLAPSAIGRGDADLFAKLAGTDYYAQTSVGEFILGTQVTSA
jgi:SagB-type dehydrogenase family enzyme